MDDETFVSDIRKAVGGCLTNGEDSVIKCSTREKGKYTSITLKVRVDNSTQLYKVNPVYFCRFCESSLSRNPGLVRAAFDGSLVLVGVF